MGPQVKNNSRESSRDKVGCQRIPRPQAQKAKQPRFTTNPNQRGGQKARNNFLKTHRRSQKARNRARPKVTVGDRAELPERVRKDSKNLNLKKHKLTEKCTDRYIFL